MNAAEILRQVVPPLLTLWVVILLMLRAWLRRRGEPWPPRGSALVTVLAGFGFFLAIVWVFQTVATRDQTALPSALTGGAALLGIALVGFAALSGIERLLRRRR